MIGRQRTLEVGRHGIEEERLVTVQVRHLGALPDEVLLQLVEVLIGQKLSAAREDKSHTTEV